MRSASQPFGRRSAAPIVSPVDDRDPSAVLADALRDEPDFAEAFDDDDRERTRLFDVALLALPFIFGIAGLWLAGVL